MDLTVASWHRRSRTAIGAAAVVACALAVAPAAPVSARASHADAKAIPSDGRPRDARLTIRAAGVHRLAVVAYRGRTDDAPGTRIQNRGIAAAPTGPRGGTGPGGIGNYQ